MEQADEMGEDGERDKDDGFVEGGECMRRRLKKRPGELPCGCVRGTPGN